jgi:hypothetical protein
VEEVEGFPYLLALVELQKRITIPFCNSSRVSRRLCCLSEEKGGNIGLSCAPALTLAWFLTDKLPDMNFLQRGFSGTATCSNGISLMTCKTTDFDIKMDGPAGDKRQRALGDRSLNAPREILLIVPRFKVVGVK